MKGMGGSLNFHLRPVLEFPRNPSNRVTINFREYGMTEANAEHFLRVFRSGLITIGGYVGDDWGREPLNCDELKLPTVRGNNYQATIRLSRGQQQVLLGTLEGFDMVIPLLMDMAKDIQDGKVMGHFVEPGTKGNRICPQCGKNRRASSYCGNERICKYCHRKAIMNG